MGLIEPLQRAVDAKGYETPTPIQEQTFNHVMQSRDVLGIAQTGTGKTGAFSLPIIQRLMETPPKLSKRMKQRLAEGKKVHRQIRALILSPTRELAQQIGDSIESYGRFTDLKHTVIYGGVKQFRQVKALEKGVDILVATPGRLFDLIDQGHVNINAVEVFVLDEADRMLDMGFIIDIQKVIAMLPDERQNLLFSATMPKEIKKLADAILVDPAHVKIKAKHVAADTVEQHLYYVAGNRKIDLLCALLRELGHWRVLVFSRTKRGADKVVKQLQREDFKAEAIHSDKSQNMRMHALRRFKEGKTQVLVASDIAARGLDVDEIGLVVNYDLPDEPETYVHRIGRTGRAGEAGVAISFCNETEKKKLRQIERLLNRQLRVEDHPMADAAKTKRAMRSKPKKAHPLEGVIIDQVGDGDKQGGKPKKNRKKMPRMNPKFLKKKTRKKGGRKPKAEGGHEDRAARLKEGGFDKSGVRIERDEAVGKQRRGKKKVSKKSGSRGKSGRGEGSGSGQDLRPGGGVTGRGGKKKVSRKKVTKKKAKFGGSGKKGGGAEGKGKGGFGGKRGKGGGKGGKGSR